MGNRTRALIALLAVLLLAAAPASACPGDCDGDGQVTVNELLLGVNIALGNDEMDACGAFDTRQTGQVGVSDLVTAVGVALEGCPVPIIHSVAGTGLAGLNDDGLPPIDTHLYLPQDVTVGPDGRLYIVDWNNHRIRCINEDGVIETVAGSGELGDAQDGIAIYTQFNHPANVFFDHDGKMIIAAWHNSLVKRLDFSTGLVENVAGTGGRSFGGDGGPANSALLDLPSAVVVDSSGNIIIADQANYRLRLVEPDGTIHTIAGTGMPGYSGDGGPAIEAQLNAPKGQSAPPSSRIDIDRRDQIYVADTTNHRIRIIDAVGLIWTIAGTGVPGYSGDGGPAIEAQLNTPSDVAVSDNGTIYVADTMNHAVRVIRPNGIIETLAGTGVRGFSGDEGPAAEAQLDRPYGVGLAPNGTLYIADTHNHRIRRVTGVDSGPVPTPVPTPPPVIIPCTEEVGSICTHAGTGYNGFDGDGKDRLLTTLYWPFDLEFTHDGRQIVLDWNNHRVREILEDDTFITIMGTDFVGDGPPDLSDLDPEGADPLTVDLNHPTDIQVFPNGDILIAAWHNHKIRQINASDGRVRVLMGRGAGFAGDAGPADAALVNQPPRFALVPPGHPVLAAGMLFLIDQRNQRIRAITDFDAERENAIIDTIAGIGVPPGPGFNGDGPALETQLSFPTGGNPEPSGGIAIADDGSIYFADTNNHRIRRLTFADPADLKSGVITTVAGTGEAGYGGDGGPSVEARLDFPQDVEIGPDGNVYFADTNNDRVRRIDLEAGIIETVAGAGTRGYSGDGGVALEAELNRPFGIAFDAAGDLYVSDTFNGRIRRVKR